MREKISAVIITKNEEQNLERCLRSLDWADEIFVLDSGSTDRTLDICRANRCTVIQTPWLGFGETKRKAVESAAHDWVLSVDADEEVSAELKERILTILEAPDCSGYRIRRLSYYLGKLICHSGWDKDFPLRLFNRTAGNFDDSAVHESVQLEGNVGTITEPIIHYPYPDLATHFRKMNLYTDLGAGEMKEQGRRSSPAQAVFMGILKFLKMYLLKWGFLDGRAGFLLAVNSAFGVYMKYLKLWQLNR